MGAQEAGAGHDVWVDQGGRDHEREAVGFRLIGRHGQQREFEACADALQVVKTGAGYLGAVQDEGEPPLLRSRWSFLSEVFGREIARFTDVAEDHEIVLSTCGKPSSTIF